MNTDIKYYMYGTYAYITCRHTATKFVSYNTECYIIKTQNSKLNSF